MKLSVVAALLVLVVSVAADITLAAEIAVADGRELGIVLSGGEMGGKVLDDGDVIVLTGEETVFLMADAPEPYYKGFHFTVRTSPARPAGKRLVTIRYTGSGKAEIFTMTAGSVQLSNIMLDGWSLEPCCPY